MLLLVDEIKSLAVLVVMLFHMPQFTKVNNRAQGSWISQLRARTVIL